MYAILVPELRDDPLARGYTGMTNAQVLASLNTVNRTLQKTTISGPEVYEAIDTTEFLAKTTAQQQEVWNIIHLDSIPCGPGSKARTRMVAIFGGGSATTTAIGALLAYQVSRAEELKLGQLAIEHIGSARTMF